MSSVSGLSERHRAQARRTIMEGAELLLANPAAVHYTQGPRRWDGINKGLRVDRGQRPSYGDCSSTATWLIWNGIAVPYGCRDTVNAANWRAGYTGTMLEHGKVVVHPENIKIGDCFIYGRRGSTGAHVAISIGGTRALSHGSEAGPFVVDYRYRPDLMCVRRYI